MTAEIPSWLRPHFQPGGGDPFLFYKIHGAFAEPLELSLSKHRSAGVPVGCELQLLTTREALDFGLDRGWIGDAFRAEQPVLAAEVARTEQCLVLRGSPGDPDTLDYFRDAVGLVMAVLDSGGIAVFDPQMFKWWSTAEWRRDAFEPAGAVPHHHVVILASEDSHGCWYHTRGLRKFGRPDLSIHDVPPELEPAVRELCDRFIEMLAFGAVIPDGQLIRMPGLPAWKCRHAGDFSDPDFNNVHIEIGP
ncbi:MAG TPA: hypothetical protein VF516_21540 [Kofleriaceae bacterium]